MRGSRYAHVRQGCVCVCKGEGCVCMRVRVKGWCMCVCMCIAEGGEACALLSWLPPQQGYSDHMRHCMVLLARLSDTCMYDSYMHWVTLISSLILKGLNMKVNGWEESLPSSNLSGLCTSSMRSS